jgi:hypothetical protein
VPERLWVAFVVDTSSLVLVVLLAALVAATLGYAMARLLTAAPSAPGTDALDEVAGEPVVLPGRHGTAAGGEVALRDLATECAQAWADALGPHERSLTAAIDGNLDATYAPGPIEHVLDTLLVDVVRRGRGPVRLTFDADEEGHLHITVTSAESAAAESTDERTVAEARAAVTALGGRLEGSHPRTGLTVLLPRR